MASESLDFLTNNTSYPFDIGVPRFNLNEYV